MDKHAAQTMIQDTLGRSFNKDRFFYFLKNMLNHVEGNSSALYKGSHLPDSYKPSIESLERLGKYKDDEGNEIDLLVVQLKRETSLERARTLQRNFASWHLKGGTGENLKDAALTAYVSPDQKDWRFSFVKMDYKFVQSEKGRMRVKEEFTPARRYSFLVGENENSHTAKSQLLPLLEDDEKKPNLGEIEDKFNIETVTKEFFERYRDLFLRITDSLNQIVESGSPIKEDFIEKNVNPLDFSKKLLGQIVFLYFLQKKGWFGVERDSNWGTGSKNFIRDLFNKKNTTYKNFFNDILEPLFYEALANERTSDFYAYLNCKIPFLNGGLFDPIGNYDWVHTDILLPNDLFSNKIQTAQGDIGTGIFDVFDRYNFTVKEDEPLEKEVAVDPEMLGKVFENLLEIKDRKSKGTYYTPREIVHFMCQKGLINHIHSELKEVISREEIERLFKFGEMVVEHDSRVAKSGKETERYSFKLPENIRKNAELIDNSLSSLKICDPAVGSGAFLVGMMTEVVRTRNALTHYWKNQAGRTNYNFKRHAIQNCLYGVDLDPGAIEIAKLRLWLSLVVDEDDIKQIKPLPNLDYKIVSGNSLIGVERDLYNIDLFKELENLKPLYFSETNNKKKLEYKNQIESIIKSLSNGKNEFEFEIYFSEIFHDKNGFDIVIANPPYVSGKSGSFSNEEKKYFNKTYDVAEYQLDTYVLFTEKGVRICRKGGVLVYIMPNSWLANIRLIKIRKFLLNKTSILNIVVNPSDTFSSAVVDTIILIAQNYSIANNKISVGSFSNWNYGIDTVLDQSTFRSNKNFIFDISLNQKTRVMLKKIESGAKLIKDICDVNRGVHAYRKDGYGKSKFSEGYQTERDYVEKSYHANNKINATYYKEVRGKNIFSYYFTDSGKYVSWGDWLAEPRSWKYFSGERLYLRKIVGQTLFATFVGEDNVADQSVYIAKSKTNEFKTKYLLALLNSKLITWYFRVKANEFDDLFPQIKVTEFKQLPIKKAKDQKAFISVVDKILYMKKKNPKSDVTSFEEEINNMVYSLYDMSDDDVEEIEISFSNNANKNN
jgi:hypothetical protein